MNNIELLLRDTRLCRSENLQRFFRNKRNRIYNSVIRFEGKLWFVNFGWDDPHGKSFAGVPVISVACNGGRAKTCYPAWQHPSKWEDVTEWFWGKYWEQGKVSLPEIWNIEAPHRRTSKEVHSI